MPKSRSVYRCTECGHEHPKWVGRCEECSAWNSVAEEPAAAEQRGRGQRGSRSGRNRRHSQLRRPVCATWPSNRSHGGGPVFLSLISF